MLIISKSDEQKRAEAQVMCDFKGNPRDPAHREAAEATARYVEEQNREINQKKERCF